jgi:hypothetical protein
MNVTWLPFRNPPLAVAFAVGAAPEAVLTANCRNMHNAAARKMYLLLFVFINIPLGCLFP